MLLRAGIRDRKAIQNFGSSLHQVHVELVVLATIRAIRTGNHRPRFTLPAAAASGNY